eukprot:3877716-Pleurochrysis_carterae.AAC.1
MMLVRTAARGIFSANIEAASPKAHAKGLFVLIGKQIDRAHNLGCGSERWTGLQIHGGTRAVV